MRGSNAEFWEKKITRNMERDVEVTCQLEALGWTVLRFWGKEIEKNLDGCVRVVEETIFDQMIQLTDENE